MGIVDSGADILVELKNDFARALFENEFRRVVFCPPLNFRDVPNPGDLTQRLTAVGLVPRLEKSRLRQDVHASVPHVYIDLTLVPSVGILQINGQPASEITFAVEIIAGINQDAVVVAPDLTLLSALTGQSLGALSSVKLPLDLLSDQRFSARPLSVALKLVGPDANLALAIDADLTGTVLQFSGDCPKSVKPMLANLNGAAADLDKFRQSYNSALLGSSVPADVAIMVDKDVLAAKIRTVQIDITGSLECTRLWLVSAGPQQMTVDGQGCAYHSTCVGDWWDAGWRAGGRLVVHGGGLQFSYQAQDAYLTDTDSGWDTCVDALAQLRNLGIDKGYADLGIPSTLGQSTDPTGRISVYTVQHRAEDAVLFAFTDLQVLGDARLLPPAELLFASGCGGALADTASFDLEHAWSSGGPLHVCALSIQEDPNNLFSVIEPTTPFSVEVGTKRTVKVRCAGQTGQNYSAALSVVSNGGPCIVALKALFDDAALDYPPAIDLTDSSYIDFCTHKWIDQATRDVELRNTGTGGLRVCQVTVVDDPGGAFAVMPERPLPVILKSGETLGVKVTFTPQTLDMVYSANLRLTTSLPDTTIALTGSLTHATDYSGDHMLASASARSVLCGRVLYEPPPFKKPFPPELVARYVDLLDVTSAAENRQLFLELVLTGLPRDSSIQALGAGRRPVARLASRFNTKILVVPHDENAQTSFLMSSDSGREAGEAHFVLRNWCYNLVGVLANASPIHEFTVAGRFVFVGESGALGLAEVARTGSVHSRTRFKEWGGAVGLAMLGDRLLLARDDGVHVLNAALPAELVQTHELRVHDELNGVVSANTRLYHVHSALAATSATGGLAYAFGSQLHVIATSAYDRPEVLASHELAETPRRGFIWGHHLFLVGTHSLARFDLTNPTTPAPAGIYQSERSITNGFVVGCMGILAHDGPSATLVDITRRELLREIGGYEACPSLAPLFPGAGPIYMDGRFLYSVAPKGDGLHVGKLVSLPIDPGRLAEWRSTRRT